jgi:hypothetical protein
VANPEAYPWEAAEQPGCERAVCDGKGGLQCMKRIGF